ncbi:hypothetical protein [Oleiagrimonas soli]|uniref:Uncharacterized protein n=1 Tax=Oleiagrimonas soli TaxID=1543381 RepID=A0A841KLJ3_9GAMM|nr:hypothetical protein [Oleiagrimonas soli]MBB6182854.1 hypothetical protein [Oleiagrimonas soli]
MQNYVSSFNQNVPPSRAFARLKAREVAATPEKEDLFLSMNTDPTRPEPEMGIMG